MGGIGGAEGRGKRVETARPKPEPRNLLRSFLVGGWGEGSNLIGLNPQLTINHASQGMAGKGDGGGMPTADHAADTLSSRTRLAAICAEDRVVDKGGVAPHLLEHLAALQAVHAHRTVKRPAQHLWGRAAHAMGWRRAGRQRWGGVGWGARRARALWQGAAQHLWGRVQMVAREEEGGVSLWWAGGLLRHAPRVLRREHTRS